ncbi:CK1/TTBKL protein kinase [Aphelenchoides fujianensis]|nr:CK1/TTBKL protein kinase [Aphelenchoides fujianensis]
MPRPKTTDPTTPVENPPAKHAAFEGPLVPIEAAPAGAKCRLIREAVHNSADGKERIFFGTYKARKSDAKTSVVGKIVLAGDDFALSAFREARVWALVRRYGPPVRLLPPLVRVHPNVLVFPMAGGSLTDVRRRHGPFGAEATLRLGLEMLAAVRELHSAGFVHRNLTPGHFCLDHSNRPDQLFGRVVLIDLSQAAPYFSFAPFDAEIPPCHPRPNRVFCSPNVALGADGRPAAHEQPFGRRDDLFSWVYIMLHLHAAGLPWANAPPAEMAAQKQKATNLQLIETCKPLGAAAGQALGCALSHLRACDVEQVPRYALLFNLLADAIEELGEGQTLVHYNNDLRAPPEVMLIHLLDAVVHPPRFAYWSQMVKSDADHKAFGAAFRKAFSREDGARFEQSEATAAEARNRWMERYGIKKHKRERPHTPLPTPRKPKKEAPKEEKPPAPAQKTAEPKEEDSKDESEDSSEKSAEPSPSAKQSEYVDKKL